MSHILIRVPYLTQVNTLDFNVLDLKQIKSNPRVVLSPNLNSASTCDFFIYSLHNRQVHKHHNKTWVRNVFNLQAHPAVTQL